jgi:hypothetical protein
MEAGMSEEYRVTPEAISDWRTNYDLHGRTPIEAAMLWASRVPPGYAPAGAVAALGTAIQEIERLWAEQDDAQTTITNLETERNHYAREWAGLDADATRNVGLLDAIERIGTERDMLRDECERRAKETALYRRELGEMEIRLAGVESERDHYRAAMQVPTTTT